MSTKQFPSISHLSRLVRDLQWWQRVFWNSSFRLGFLTWWRCLTQCLDRWASTTVNEERVWHVVAVFVLQSFLWGLRRNRSETDWFWCFHLPLRSRFPQVWLWCSLEILLILLLGQTTRHIAKEDFENRSETWNWSSLMIVSLTEASAFLACFYYKLLNSLIVWCRLSKQLSLAENLMLLNFSPLTADQLLPTEAVLGFVWPDLHGMVVSSRMKSHHFPEVQTDCIWCEQDNGADTGPTCAPLAMITIKACFCWFDDVWVAIGKWTFWVYRESDTFESLGTWSAVMTTCLLEFLISLRVLNLMAMFDTMSGPLSKHHGERREGVACCSSFCPSIFPVRIEEK